MKKEGEKRLKGTGNVTIYDVAKKANCSTATVSLALKGDPKVNFKTRERVIQCAQELKYKPNYLARSLVNQRTNSIGVIVSNLNNPVFSEIISGIDSYISQHNYYLTIGVTYFQSEREKHFLDMFSHNRTDGIILLPTDWEAVREDALELRQRGYPVCISGIHPGTDALSYVASNMVDGAFMSVEHLIRLGHTDIAFLAGSASANTHERLAGYKKALSIYGIDVNEDYIITSEVDLSSIRATLKKFIREHPAVTAIFCMYDYIALAAIKAMADLHLRVPEDISIVGYDNINIAEYYSVGLTTVDPDNKQIGELSGRILVNMIEKEKYTDQGMLLTPKLIVRESTAPHQTAQGG